MRHVPIAEFKDRVSEFVAAAEAGEEIMITRHGRPAARLTAIADDQESRQARRIAVLKEMERHRAAMRAAGKGVTMAEIIEWKNEGRR